MIRRSHFLPRGACVLALGLLSAGDGIAQNAEADWNVSASSPDGQLVVKVLGRTKQLLSEEGPIPKKAEVRGNCRIRCERLAVSADGRVFAVDFGGYLEIHQHPSKAKPSRVATKEGITCLALSKNGSTVAFGSKLGVWLASTATGKEVGHVDVPGARSLCFS